MDKELYSKVDRALLKYASEKAEIYKNTYQVYRDIWNVVLDEISEAKSDEELIVAVVDFKEKKSGSEDLYIVSLPLAVQKVIDINYLFQLLELYEFGLPELEDFKRKVDSTADEYKLNVTMTVKTLREIKKQQEELLERATEKKNDTKNVTPKKDSYVHRYYRDKNL